MKTTKDLYFDWAATAPVDEDICREATEVALTYYGNPSSEHLQGSESKKILEEARERCATTLGVNAGTLYFTSGGTESDHIPLLALLQRPAPGTVIMFNGSQQRNRDFTTDISGCKYAERQG